MLLFMALFAQFAFVIPDHPILMSIGYASMVLGALVWWYGLSWLVDKVRAKFDVTGVVLINRIIGSCVIICSLITLIGTLFNIYLFPKF